MINIYDKWSNVKTAGTNTPEKDVHGMSPKQVDEMAARFEKFMPSIASKYAAADQRKSEFTTKLPPGGSWAEGKKTADAPQPNGGGRTMVTNSMPYQPEFASPDRQQYPVHRILANRYWRMFYKMDPVIGNCIEMYSDLPWSNFELTGEGVEGEIREAYEQQCRETQILAMLPYFVREYLVVGEAIPHTFFDDSKGIFTHVALHNPDQLEVIDAPFIKMDPILEFIPDDRLRSVLNSNNPELRKVKDSMPPELLSKLNARQNIQLSPLNATFIPRKLHPYDTRGTSIFSRMWRVLMLEDAIFNATIQTARRHAAPIKVAKLGNAATGWIPPPEQEKRLLELLAQAEQDPNAWLVYHYGIQFETIGTTDRAMSITREWDIIERIKLVAMGISKSFLHGEVSYASSATGLQVFLQRLKSMRLFFEQKWLYPKFFKPIAEINGWIKPKANEVSHRYRIKRSSRELEEQNRYIVPKIVWDKSLDPQISMELINAMQALEGMGVKFSKTSKMASVGYSFEEETKKIHREAEFEKAYLPKVKQAPAGEGAPGGGMGGGGMPPPMPPPGGDEDGGGAPPVSAPAGDASHPPGVPPPPSPDGASLGDKKSADGDAPKGGPSGEKEKKTYGNWHDEDIDDIVSIFKGEDPQGAFFSQLAESEAFSTASSQDNKELMRDILINFLEDKHYPQGDIDDAVDMLTDKGLISKPGAVDLSELPDNVDSMSDLDFANEVSKILRATKTKSTFGDNFLSGVDVPSSGNLNGDI